MANIVFLSRRSIEDATLAASSAQTTLPVTNLAGAQPSQVWRSDGLTSVYLRWTFSTAIAADTLALVRPNFTSAATWRLRGALVEADLTTASAIYDSGEVSVWPTTGKPTELDWTQHICLLRQTAWGGTETRAAEPGSGEEDRVVDAGSGSETRVVALPTTLTEWRLDLYDAANAAGYLEAGALLHGVATVTACNFKYGWGFGDEPLDQVVNTPYGSTHVDQRTPNRVFSLPFDFLSATDAFAVDGLSDLLRERKASKPFIVCVDPTATTYLHRQIMYGLRVGSQRFAQRFFNLYETTISMREKI